MPIRPDLRHLYGREWQREIRPRILARDKNRCKFCGKPNHTHVRQVVDRARRLMWWFDTKAHAIILRDHKYGIAGVLEELPRLDSYEVRCVLTIAHLNHDPTDNRAENLAALCQWCHLHHDLTQHAETRAARKDAARPILTAAAS